MSLSKKFKPLYLHASDGSIIVLRAEDLAHVHPQIEGEAAQIECHAARIAQFKAHDR